MNPTDMKIVLDGNDGTGKTSLAKRLSELGYKNVVDRVVLLGQILPRRLKSRSAHVDGSIEQDVDLPVMLRPRAKLEVVGHLRGDAAVVDVDEAHLVELLGQRRLAGPIVPV